MTSRGPRSIVLGTCAFLLIGGAGPDGDLDLDGLTNGEEMLLGSDPEDSDSDDDGWPDGAESQMDHDEDGLIGLLDPDSDGDGLFDGTERGVVFADIFADTDVGAGFFVADADPTTMTNSLIPDTDDDVLTDGEEDFDFNGRVDSGETDPLLPDTDGGGIGDGVEVNRGTDPLDPLDDIQVVGSGACAVTDVVADGASPGWTMLLMPLLLLLVRRRRTPRPRSRRLRSRAPARSRPGVVGRLALALVLAAVVLAMAPAAAAGQVDSSEFDLQRFKPAPGGHDILSAPSAHTPGHLAWSISFFGGYAHRPLRVINPADGTTLVPMVKGGVTLELGTALTLFHRVELGLSMPYTLGQGSESPARYIPAATGEIRSAGFGDLRLVPKLFLGKVHVASFAVLADLSLPTGRSLHFLGHGKVTVTPRLVIELQPGRRFRLAANVGVAVREKRELVNLTVGHAFVFGLGAELPFRVATHEAALLAALVGEIGLLETRASDNPLELVGAARWFLWRSLSITMGGGAGLTRGYGSSAFRVFAGIGLVTGPRPRPIPAADDPFAIFGPPVETAPSRETETETETKTKPESRGTDKEMPASLPASMPATMPASGPATRPGAAPEP